MRKVAVFGNAGGGKSKLSRRLAEITGLPMYVIDIIQYRDGRYQAKEVRGGKISAEAYREMHAELLRRDQWIIDGFDGVALVWERFAAADTLVYVDLPIMTHYWGVTTRFAAGLFKNPKGWPENSPILESTWDGYRVIARCHRHLTPKYRQLVDEMATTKRVHHLRSRREVRAFVSAVIDEYRPANPGNNPV
jgi:adenylate kinase family enzyme